MTIMSIVHIHHIHVHHVNVHHVFVFVIKRRQPLYYFITLILLWFLKNIAYIESWNHFVFVFVCVCVCLCLCICLFVSLRLGHCHHQMISFQKIYGL